jgi:hypothetical protein
MAAGTVLAHLLKLEAEGQVRRVAHDRPDLFELVEETRR